MGPLLERFGDTDLSTKVAILLAVYFWGGLLCYIFRRLSGWRHRDVELENRGVTAILGIEIRLYFAWMMRPFFELIRATGLPADAITLLSLLLAIGAGVAIAAGNFGVGAALYIASVVCDFLDGRLARMLGSSSKHGALLDSTLDRWADAAVYVGLAWFYRDSWIAVLAIAVIIGSAMVSYVRARGEGLGLDVRIGLFQRPERSAIMCVALGMSPTVSPWLGGVEHSLVVGAMVLLATGTHVTALRRLVVSHRKLGGKLFAGWSGAGRGSLVRNVVAAVTATGADFALVVLAVSNLGSDPALATALGCVLGAVVNFSINRFWVFGSRDGPVAQAGRYALVSTISAGLNAGGVALLLMLPEVHYQVAWVVVRVGVFLAWNYPLQKGYVFAPKTDEAATALPGARAAAPKIQQQIPAWLLAAGISLSVLSFDTAATAQTFKPNVADDESYSETFSFMADLDDGTYVQAQLAISNIGPGDKNGVCRAVVVPAKGKAWKAGENFDDDEWSFEASDMLKVGPCFATTKGGTKIYAKVGNGTVIVELDGKPGAHRPPGSTINSGDGAYRYDVRQIFSSARVTLKVPGAKGGTRTGRGFFDHSRSTLLPGALAKQWVRIRALRADPAYVALVRYPESGKPTGWIWREGDKAVSLDKAGLERAGQGWRAELTESGSTVGVVTQKLLLRHAPVEEHGWLGSVVGSVVGNPVTYTYRSASSGQPAIVEVSFADE